MDDETQKQIALTKEMLRRVRRVEIATRKKVTEAMSGAYHSVFRGQGMDFDEVREYSAGDDVRGIDWNVTAKTGVAHVKKFREERELVVMLVVDVSGSGLYGSGEESKREVAAELASVLAFSALKNNDKVGLIMFSDEVEKVIEAKKGRGHVLRVIREILFYEGKRKGTRINAGLDYLNRVTRHGAVVFLVSDFLGNKGWEKSMEVASKRYDLVCVRVSDEREMKLPKVGIVSLEDGESGEVVEVDTMSSETRRDYEEENRERVEGLKKYFKGKQIDEIEVKVGGDYVEGLRKFLYRRMKKR